MQFQKFRARAFDATVKSDLHSAIISLEDYFSDKNTYPATSSELLATGLNLSEGVNFTEYKIETFSGGETVHMHVKHAGSTNAWHANYPKEGSEIEIRKPKE